ncbi:MAG TPA: zf-HC2 domain-containing protein [Candidatus Sulfotelmatobacter sp.]|nr:zf-HC2 domain-containing protein [Candidatus Sulfotelmatobacter sp.]
MACEQWREKLDLYVDGELAPAEEAALRAHLQGCSGCAADALDRVQLKRSVQMAGKRYEPSAQLRAKIAKTIAKAVPETSAKSSGWGWRIVFVPAVLVLIFTLAANFYVKRERSARERVYSELADLHVATLASATPVDVISSDKHTVKPWFQGKIPFTFNLPELQGSEFTLVGGRVTYLEQTPGAHLIYQVRKHEISVFIFPERGLETPSLPAGPVNALSFNTESWTQNGLRYFVVGDASADDIAALSKLLRDAG